MKKSIGIKTQILLTTFVLFLISNIIILMTSYRIGANNLEKELLQSTELSTKSFNALTDTFFDDTEEKLKMFSKFESIYAPSQTNYAELEKLFKNYKNTSEDLNSAYVATKDNKFLSYPRKNSGSGYKPTERDWYKNAMKANGEAVWSTPYKDAFSGELVITVSQMIHETGKEPVVIGLDISLNKIHSYLLDTKLGENGFITVIGKDGKIIEHTDETMKGKDLGSKPFIQEMLNSGKEKGKIDFKENGEDKILFFQKNKTSDWYMTGTIVKSDFQKKAASVIPALLLIGSISILVSAIVLYVLIRRIFKPLQQISTEMKKVEQGDFSVEVPVKNNNEFGQLARGFNHMIYQVKNMITSIEGTSVSVKNKVNTFVESIGENKSAINDIAATMEQMANGATEQANLTDKNTQNLSVLSEEISQIEEQSKGISKQSDELLIVSDKGMNQLKQLQEQSTKTTEMTKGMVSAIQSLDTNSKSINKIINTISEIAEQTNLLALNAAIEAARAGESGREFAVVAAEVRKLAEKSAESSKQITQLIQQMQQDTSGTVNLIESTHDLIQEQSKYVEDTEKSFVLIIEKIESSKSMIDEITNKINTANEKKEDILKESMKIADITQESVAGSEAIASSLEEQNASVEQLGQLANELGAQADELLSQFSSLKK